MTGRKGPMSHKTEVERLAMMVRLLRANPQGLSSRVIADRIGYSLVTVRKDLLRSELFMRVGMTHSTVHKLTEGAQ